MEGERSIPIEAEPFARLVASAGRHGRVGDVEDLVGVIYVGDGVAASVSCED